MRVIAALFVIACTLVFLSGVAGGYLLRADHRPAGIGQGWRDVCASVGPDTPRPLEWRFTAADGRTVASGVCV